MKAWTTGPGRGEGERRELVVLCVHVGCFVACLFVRAGCFVLLRVCGLFGFVA